MSVSALSTVLHREFEGWADPGLPTGFWAGTVSVVGDASGGQRAVELQFNPSTAPRDRLFYSLELCTMFDTDNNAKVGVIEAINVDSVTPSTMQFTRVLPLLAGLSQAGVTPEAVNSLRGTFLGGQVSAGVVTRVAYRTTNVNTAILAFNAQGYFWGPRSILVSGGLRRPPDGMYAR